jgi:hypothetical protein
MSHPFFHINPKLLDTKNAISKDLSLPAAFSRSRHLLFIVRSIHRPGEWEKPACFDEFSGRGELQRGRRT